jgi:hypothetical protein
MAGIVLAVPIRLSASYGTQQQCGAVVVLAGVGIEPRAASQA